MGWVDSISPTNDIRLPSLPELKVLALDTLKAQTESA